MRHFKVPAGGGQESGEKSVVESEWRLEGLQGVGPQRVLVFSPDGSRLAAAGEGWEGWRGGVAVSAARVQGSGLWDFAYRVWVLQDKRVRVFAWPAMTLLLDVPPDGAHASSAPLADADFSPICKDLRTLPVMSLARLQPSSSRAGPRPTGEQEAAGAGATGAKTPGVAAPLPASFGFCKFTRDEKKPLLFTTVTRDDDALPLAPLKGPHVVTVRSSSSLDGGLLATSAPAGPVRVWDVSKAALAPPAPASGPAPAPAPVPVGTLLLNAPSSSRAGPRPTGEQEAAGAGATGAKTPGVAAPLPASFGFCKFTRDEKKPLLFTTVTRGGKGFIVVWNMATWGLIGVRRIYHQPITCFAASRSGRMLATGNARGDVSVLDIKTMSMRQRVSAAHLGPVSALSFHPSSRYLLSVSRDGTARVTALKRYSDDLAVWQIYLLIFLFAALTVAVAFGFNYYGQWFWRMPLGNEQRMYRNPEYLVARS
eukprot:jgi/Mesen1/477/ME000101S10701